MREFPEDQLIFGDLPTGKDPFLHALQECEEMINAQGWDQEPTYLMVSVETIPEVSIGTVSISISQMPEPCYAHPPTALPALCDAFEEFGISSDQEFIDVFRRIVPTGFRGIGLFVEGWTVPEDAPGVEVAYAAEEFYIHPDRTEVRTGIMALTNGTILVVNRKRGCEPEAGRLRPEHAPYFLAGLPSAVVRLVGHYSRMWHVIYHEEQGH